MVTRSVPWTRALTLEVPFGVSRPFRPECTRSSAGNRQDQGAAYTATMNSRAQRARYISHLDAEVTHRSTSTDNTDGAHTMPP
ncbi:hypothetical protein QFZ21_004149 [Microbacterium sp. W4I20]|nr:hypothetical protein [Microbacterium sp. W4I20]